VTKAADHQYGSEGLRMRRAVLLAVVLSSLVGGSAWEALDGNLCSIIVKPGPRARRASR
jgi:hypothetical protein